MRQISSQLRDVTCYMGSRSITGHPTQVNAPRLNPSQYAGTQFTYLPLCICPQNAASTVTWTFTFYAQIGCKFFDPNFCPNTAVTLAPDPAGRAYSAPPDPLAGFKGPTSKGRGGKGREGGRFDPHFSLPSAAPAYNNKPWEFHFKEPHPCLGLDFRPFGPQTLAPRPPKYHYSPQHWGGPRIHTAYHIRHWHSAWHCCTKPIKPHCVMAHDDKFMCAFLQWLSKIVLQ